MGAVVAGWLSSWLAEQEDRGSIPGLATWIFRDWLSPASKSRYGWTIAKSTLILKTTNQPTNTHVITLCTRFDICSSGKVNSGERYPNRVVSFGLNRAYMEIRTSSSCYTDKTWFLNIFYGFSGFVVWEISGHFGGVYQSRYCASDGTFLFSFVNVMNLDISSYLYGKQIKSKFGNTIHLWMIFICVHLNRLGLNECRTRILKVLSQFSVHLISKLSSNNLRRRLCTAHLKASKVSIHSKRGQRSGILLWFGQCPSMGPHCLVSQSAMPKAGMSSYISPPYF